MPITNVYIIGAGPAGLTAAYFLTKNNLRPIIYESGKEIGGLAGSVNLWGKSFDIGPHIFLESSQPEAVNFWKEIGGDNLQQLTLSRGMILNKRLIHYPPRPGGIIRSIGFFRFYLAAISAIKAKISFGIEIKNAGDFFRNYYGNYFRKLIFTPFCEKYMGIADSNVDTGFATGLTSFLKKSGKTDVQPEKKKLKTLLYPKQGTKMMWTRIAEKILEKGEIIFEKKVTKITTKAKRIERIYFNDGTNTDINFLISTLPVTVFLRLLDNCPIEILEDAQNLKSRNTVIVYLLLNESAFSYQYITVFDHSLEVGRITNFNSWQKGNIKNENTVLCFEYWCDAKDDNWVSTNEEMITKTINEMSEAGIIQKDKVIDSKILKLPNSHPILKVGFMDSLTRINNYLAEFENLEIAGRHATFKWDGQADNIIAGMRLAEKIANKF